MVGLLRELLEILSPLNLSIDDINSRSIIDGGLCYYLVNAAPTASSFNKYLKGDFINTQLMALNVVKMDVSTCTSDTIIK